MALPALAPDRLHVLVFGPGTGELIAVRAPPGDWLLVDGCGVGRTKYGLALLEHYRASPRLLALTHPHRDHAVGVGDVVDAFTQGPLSQWPKILSIAADGSTRLAHGPGSIQVTEAGRASRPRRRVVGARRARSRYS